MADEVWVSIAGLPPTKGVPIEDIGFEGGRLIPDSYSINREGVTVLIDRLRARGVETENFEEKILQGTAKINGHPLLVID
jgi:hypothetical protein